MISGPITPYVAAVRHHAAGLRAKGFRLLRVQLNGKIPIDRGWPELATDDIDAVDVWFAQEGPECNIGVACGPQPNKINLVCIDVDTKHDGLSTWAAFLDINGHPDTAMHATPTGGLHIFFDCPFEVSNSNRLPQGIDVRGKGGQVVVPPSTRIIDGDLLAYEAVPGRGLWEYPVAPLPEWLCGLLRPVERPATVGRPSVGIRASAPSEGLDNADWLREQWNWRDDLVERMGYDLVREVGDEAYFRHPTATSEWSCKAEMPNGRMNAWSSNMPAALDLAKQDNRDGSISWSPFWWFVATEHDGDYSSAAREINRRRGGYVERHGSRPERAAGETAPGQAQGTEGHRLPTLPDEFWQHPLNAHVLAAARARRCGPDALMLNVLLRLSVLIPPSFLLPPLAGGFSPLNLLGCVVGRTGEGKSVSIAAASDVIVGDHPWLLWDMPLGTGEGVGDVFMMDEVEPDEKGVKRKTGRRVQNPDLHACHFTVDEGAALVEIGNRKGATIIPALCKAWTGVTLGETNASVATRRRVRALSYRVAAVVNIQPVNFHRLFNTANTGTGLTGRFLFAPAADYDMPDVRGIWPGEIDFPVLHGSASGNTLDYHPDIYAEVDAAIVTANRTGGTPENVSHANLLRARVAAIYALADDRRTVEPADWHVAGLLTNASAELLFYLDQQAAQIVRDDRHSLAMAKAEVDLVVEDVKDRQATARMAEAIKRSSEGSIALGALRKKVSSAATRPRFEAALHLAISNGWVRVVEGRVETA